MLDDVEMRTLDPVSALAVIIFGLTILIAAIADRNRANAAAVLLLLAIELLLFAVAAVVITAIT